MCAKHDGKDLDKDQGPGGSESSGPWDRQEDRPLATHPCPYCAKMVAIQDDVCPYCHSFISFDDTPQRWTRRQRLLLLLLLLLLLAGLVLVGLGPRLLLWLRGS